MIAAQLGQDVKLLLKFAKLKQGSALNRALIQATTVGAAMVQARARQKILSGSKTGRVYGSAKDVAAVAKHGYGQKGAKGASKRVHIASAPGEPPANWYGHLQRSIAVVRAKSQGYRVTAQVIVRDDPENPYGKWLEEGTKRMKPRPFLGPSLSELKSDINKMILAAVREGTKQDGGQ